MIDPNDKIYQAQGAGEFSAQLARRLQKIYPQTFSEGLVNRIMALADPPMPALAPWNEGEIVLIVYGNTLQKDGEIPLDTLYRFIAEHFSHVFSCVHLLPFFPSTSDDGFAVSDYLTVDPGMGNWTHVYPFTEKFTLMGDLVINHVSSHHPWFTNFKQNLEPGRDYFIEAEIGADYSQVVRPRSSPLFTRVETLTGPKMVWTTFSDDQIDLNFANPAVLLEMLRILAFYIRQGMRIIRLDAIAFLWKKSGTACLHLPETHEIVKLLRDFASFLRPGTIMPTETNVPNKQNWSYFGDGDEAHMVYQFSLPPLLLHGLFSGDATYLKEWAGELPVTAANQTFLNYTASHDGIGLRPLEGILPEHEIHVLIKGMTDCGGMVSHKTNPDGSHSPYELNITYFDAMKGTAQGIDHLQEARFICSQLIMLALPGIPAFYIHSLFAATNDYEAVKSTGRARRINRRQFNLHELKSRLNGDNATQRMLHELTRLIRIRKKCSAFHPESSFQLLKSGEAVFAFKRINQKTGVCVYCLSNLGIKPVAIHEVLPENRKGYDLLTGDWFAGSDPILLAGCQTKWIVEEA